ncbi:BtrH N-terminal domain-containing protein [Microbacterium yannicii]|uniref:BtrH N-terminal domain-containing protein n=1 Tax=Microbacterium yannicii TaxID=671622 RepID=UPI0002EB9F59|nr:BtrH N-terminal domain-containing protein [Microbacterium yannicii]
MTERRAFKARVRARMAETGQTYAQAAALLEAGNPARAVDTHPASALVVALLRTEGIALAPELAFGIGGGIGFMYAVFSYKEVGHPLLTIVCQHHPEPWAPAILERLRVPHVSVRTRPAVAALIGEGRPMILPLGRGHLPWLRESQDPREEHVVLALPGASGCRVLDGSGASHHMSANDLLAAYMGTRRTHPVISLEAGARAASDADAALGAGLRACVAGMTGPVLGNAFDVNFGLSGLRKWARLSDAAGRDGWPTLFKDTDIWRHRLVDGIEREHTARTAGRPLFARVLRSGGAARAAHTFEQSAHHWANISHRAASGTITFPELAREITRIAELETEGIRLLSARLDGEEGGRTISPTASRSG